MDDPVVVDLDEIAERCARALEVPSSTYRLQLGPDLGFDDARALAPYLASLGAGAVYLSPCLRTRPGSPHGYDVVDHTSLNPDLGGAAAFEAMARAFRDRGMGVILDFVPNHMSVDPVENLAWRDVLENGPSARAAEWFDIDWRPVQTSLHDKVLLPILGDQYGAVLERGEIRVAISEGAFEVQYFEHRLPLNPQQVPVLFDGLLPMLSESGPPEADSRELLSVLTAFGNLPPYTSRSPESREERHRETRVAYERLGRLLSRSAAIAAFVQRAIEKVNGEPSRPDSFDRLHTLLERQPYRLAYWRTAFDEINYRRFFDINELAAVRMENRRVFEDTHRLVLDLVGRGLVTGLRIDHPDGLADPEAYFEQLQEAAWRAREAAAVGPDARDCVPALVARRAAARAAEPRHPAVRPLYVVAEKIVSPGERFPDGWAIHGGTGYRFLNHVNGLLVDPAGLHQIGRLWSRITGQSMAFEQIAYECRRLIAQTAMASEMNMLAHALENIAGSDRRTRDFTLNSLRKVLREVVACFPVYRTYVSERGVSETDRAVVRRAVGQARLGSPVMERSIFDFVEDALTGGAHWGTADARWRFAVRAQQITGPIQAKGLEDTAFYRYVPLLAVNEVGSHPAAPAVSVAEFHETNLGRLADWPATMTALETHDTKRSGDARARLAGLSERPTEWRREVAAWSRLNARHRVSLSQGSAPNRADEYHLYQALAAIWPAEPESAPIPTAAPDALVGRLTGYMVKAVREAKERSSWLRPDAAYEDAVVVFTEAVTRGAGARRFLARFVPFVRILARQGAVNTLSQLVLQLASPGVPDVYQGADDWHFALVDPDNRGAVNFAARLERLAGFEPWLARAASGSAESGLAAFVAEMAAGWADGRVKTWVLAACLRHRQIDPTLFLAGAYVPLITEPAEAPVVALARVANGRAALVVAPRLASRLTRDGTWPVGEVWGDARVILPDSAPGDTWRDRLTGRTCAVRREGGIRWMPVSVALSALPVAWLERTDG